VLERADKESPRPSQARRDAPVQCPVCDRVVERASRQQKFCSVRCRQRSAYAENVRTGVFSDGLGQDTRFPTNPIEKSNGFNGLQAAKSGSTPAIYGPRRVIEAELFAGRDWAPVVSPDGVICMVAPRLRMRRRS
jgi:hypothetical protein